MGEGIIAGLRRLLIMEQHHHHQPMLQLPIAIPIVIVTGRSKKKSLYRHWTDRHLVTTVAAAKRMIITPSSLPWWMI